MMAGIEELGMGRYIMDVTSPLVDGTQPCLPSTVMMQKGSSEGTGPTHIETSPLSEEHYSPMHAGSIDDNGMRMRGTGCAHNLNLDIHENAVSGDTKVGLTSISKSPYSQGRRFTKRNHTNTKRHDHQKKNNEAFIWRMDASASFSDVTLHVVGVDDKVAINNKYMDHKEKRKDEKRRGAYGAEMKEGLLLDMLESESDSDKDLNMKDIRGHLDIHSTISGTKTSKYPVIDKYHLHRVHLAVGPKSCEYFARAFKKKGPHGEGNCTIAIPLSCMSVVPDVLDFMYNPDTSAAVRATTSTVVPLRHLGVILGNRQLFNSATKFLQNNLRPENAIQYLQHAELYQQKKLAKVCIRICAENFDVLRISWLAALSPTLMKRIVHSRYFTCSGPGVCSKVASYIRCQMHNIDRDLLLLLTSAKIMPFVSPDEALFLIQMMVRLGMDIVDDANKQMCRPSKERSLYERCIFASPLVAQCAIDSLRQVNKTDTRVANGQKETSRRWSRGVSANYSRLPPQVKVDILEYTLAMQKNKE